MRLICSKTRRNDFALWVVELRNLSSIKTFAWFSKVLKRTGTWEFSYCFLKGPANWRNFSNTVAQLHMVICWQIYHGIMNGIWVTFSLQYLLLQAYWVWNMCGWIGRGVGNVPRTLHSINSADNFQLTHGLSVTSQHGWRRAHRLHPEASSLNLCDCDQSHRAETSHAFTCVAQLQLSVRFLHSHPVITSHYTASSSLENLARSVSFTAGEVMWQTYVRTYMRNYAITRSFITRFPLYL